ncbi:MAG: hypothetical protein ACP59X_09885 [Solidesulfovibrio sp. DCME]|uniref:phage major tropism determinant n=1 Tax=Solidesulfovibrio sp. DCME TaxID=3447380 RepID=UPI003D0E102B
MSISLNEAEAWCAADIDVYGDFTNPLLRAGKDFYLYAIESASGASILVSPRSTYPTGYTEATSRKIGGFHCLCTDVGVISGHPLSGYVAGDILPASVWDLKHRPVCAPEGMVYVAGINRWVDIYLASVSGGKLVSVNGGAIADGASATAFHWYKFSQWLGAIGKRMPTQHDFVAASRPPRPWPWAPRIARSPRRPTTWRPCARRPRR